MHLYKTNKKQARGENQEFCCVQEYRCSTHLWRCQADRNTSLEFGDRLGQKVKVTAFKNLEIGLLSNTLNHKQ